MRPHLAVVVPGLVLDVAAEQAGDAADGVGRPLDDGLADRRARPAAGRRAATRSASSSSAYTRPRTSPPQASKTCLPELVPCAKPRASGAGGTVAPAARIHRSPAAAWPTRSRMVTAMPRAARAARNWSAAHCAGAAEAIASPASATMDTLRSPPAPPAAPKAAAEPVRRRNCLRFRSPVSLGCIWHTSLRCIHPR